MAESEGPYASGTYYSANFVSPSLEPSNLGHWSFEAGTPAEVRQVLRTNLAGSPLQLIGNLGSGVVPIQLIEIPGDRQNIHRGHIVARWLCGGRAFAVSVHGYQHQEVGEAMAKDLLGLVESVESCD